MGFGDLIGALVSFGGYIGGAALGLFLALYVYSLGDGDSDAGNAGWGMFVKIAAAAFAFWIVWVLFWEFVYCFDSDNDCALLGGEWSAFDLSSNRLIPWQLERMFTRD